MSIYFVLALTLLNQISMFAARITLVLYALKLGAQPLTVGILGAMFSLFPALLAVVAGKLSDRFGSRWPLIFGVAGGGIGMLVPYFIPGLPAIFAGMAMLGFALVFFGVPIQNLVGLLSKPDARVQNFSNFSMMLSISAFVGPLIAGFSIDHFGHVATCLYLALLTLAPIAMLAIWGGMLPRGTSKDKHASGGIRVMLSVPGVRRVLATGSLQTTGDSLYQYYMPVYMHSIGFSASTIGTVLAMYAAAAFVARLVMTRLIARFTEEKVLAYAFYLGAVSAMLVPFFQAAAVLMLLSFMFGLGMGCCAPIVTMLMFANSPEGRSGEALGLKVMVNQFTKVISPIALGSITSAFGLPPAFWITSLMLGSGGVLSRPRTIIGRSPPA